MRAVPRRKPTHKIVEANVRRLTSERGMTFIELSGAAGVSRTQLYHFFAGEKDVTLGWLQRLADALNVELAKLVTDWETRS